MPIHRLKNVKVIQSDMFSRVEGKFDIILANSPYIEDDFEAEEQQFATSRKYFPPFSPQVSDYLADNGRLVNQFISKSRSRIEKLAAQHGLELLSVERLPPKEPMLSLLSVLYLQIGFGFGLVFAAAAAGSSTSASRWRRTDKRALRISISAFA